VKTRSVGPPWGRRIGLTDLGRQTLNKRSELERQPVVVVVRCETFASRSSESTERGAGLNKASKMGRSASRVKQVSGTVVVDEHFPRKHSSSFAYAASSSITCLRNRCASPLRSWRR